MGKDVDLIIRDLVEVSAATSREAAMRRMRVRAEDAAEEVFSMSSCRRPVPPRGEPIATPSGDSATRQAFRKKSKARPAR